MVIRQFMVQSSWSGLIPPMSIKSHRSEWVNPFSLGQNRGSSNQPDLNKTSWFPSNRISTSNISQNHPNLHSESTATSTFYTDSSQPNHSNSPPIKSLFTNLHDFLALHTSMHPLSHLLEPLTSISSQSSLAHHPVLTKTAKTAPHFYPNHSPYLRKSCTLASILFTDSGDCFWTFVWTSRNAKRSPHRHYLNSFLSKQAPYCKHQSPLILPKYSSLSIQLLPQNIWNGMLFHLFRRSAGGTYEIHNPRSLPNPGLGSMGCLIQARVNLNSGSPSWVNLNSGWGLG